jgi:sugar phosphate isomerase/epimerase
MVYYQEPIEKLLPYLHNWNIKIIEIRPKIGHFQPQRLEEVIELKKKLQQSEILVKSIHIPIDDVDISHPEEYDRIKSVREVEKVIMIASNLKAEIVVVHPGANSHEADDRKKRLALSMESLKEIVDFSKGTSIRIALENTLPGRVGDRWEEIQQIIEEIPSENLGICLDTGHYLVNYQCILQKDLHLDKLPINWQDKLFHIHIHDNNGKKDAHLLPGEGVFPWPSFMDFIKEINYQGTLIIEPTEQQGKHELSEYLNRAVEIGKRMQNYFIVSEFQ